MLLGTDSDTAVAGNSAADQVLAVFVALPQGAVSVERRGRSIVPAHSAPPGSASETSAWGKMFRNS